MTTITFTFENGFVGTLTHHNPEQIKRWLEVFDNQKARESCGIAEISVEGRLSEAA